MTPNTTEATKGALTEVQEERAAVKRREFLKVLGVSTAATAAVGCGTTDVEKLIPYLVSPDNTVPGVSNYYATTCRECAAGCGLIVEVRDGRAIKAEGNPEHPVNRGALCARGQSSLQALYNPDRYRGPMKREGAMFVPTTWDDAIGILAQKLGEAKSRNAGRGVAFINGHEQGSFPAVLDQILAGYGAPAHLSYDAEAPVAVAIANRAAYGTSWPHHDFGAADLIVSFAADFLDGWGVPVPQQLEFAEARGKVEGAPRFIYVGARRTLTGLNADSWIPARPGTELTIVNALLGRGSLAAAAEEAGVAVALLEGLRDEIRNAKASAILGGGYTTNSGELAAAVAELNKQRGNVGKTILPNRGLNAFEGVATLADVRALTERMNAGDVTLAMVRNANPAYTTPPSLGFAAAFAKVPFKVAFSSIPDETTALCDLILPDHHSLESWGDAEPVNGRLSLQQPVMDPVFDSRSTADVLLAVAKSDPSLASRFPAADYRAWLASRVGGNSNLRSALTTAMINGSALSRTGSAGRTTAKPAAAGAGEYHLVTYLSPTVGDGRGANKPWLQELPDPVTKICWQTVVEMHGETAAALGIEDGDMVTVTTDAGTLTAPAFIYLGIRPDTIAVMVGRGQSESAGRYAVSGENAYALGAVTEDARTGAAVYGATKARLAKATGNQRLVTTEGSGRQHGRNIAQATTIAALLAGENEVKHHHFDGQASTEFEPGLRSPTANDAQGEFGVKGSKDKGMYDPEHWSGAAKRRWAMTIDLAKCTGCSACVTACYAENNIPTVGASWQGPVLLPDRTGFGANITRSREMSWIRLERYYEIDREPRDVKFDPAHPDFETRFIPMMCQHCGNAPCEPVCPVYATYHAPNGLNVQVYNRCVGTRYCSNNCPYKVRYYNWFGYGDPNRSQYAFPEPLHWQLNPDVTVRQKGIMEKCTFCVQRIKEAENRVALEGRDLQPDEFTTACAQACPSRAIIFGDAADENWSVAKWAKDRRAYHVFEELNTYTAVVYLQKVNHPAPSASAHA
ncbi:4Fe-4S dicluster domain-containing protein [Pseudogemmatithrix spongiicola]|uniref:4Fe-4S dicluster domain-containing protein n=1 Tax=Pseudogemmatithrix spongiicola TaxID=3062599 RepID=A0AA49JV65_9BACT|nr:4Fe-4S dicluster domain-containing protein [Gemmatimonadaceae bacterium 'strain 138']WKW15501.1 4Fe-4S dicluster domain-containing protein [Gemmatimonadaceae bacterium 'strain 318']